VAIGREMSDLSILLVGDAGRSEFRAAWQALVADSDSRAALSDCDPIIPIIPITPMGLMGIMGIMGRYDLAPDAGGQFDLVDTPTIESAAELLASGEFTPEVIVVAQAYPGQFSHGAIDRLRRLAPLARVLGLMGSWCEGEMRSGQPWPGAIRIYWHQWPARCGQELGRLAQGACPAWGLPVTASEEERLLAEADAAWPPRQGLIAIHARSFDVADMLAAACRGCGYATVWLHPSRPARVTGVAAALFDGSDLRGPEGDQLQQLAAALRPAPVVALLSFPRIEDRDRAVSLGAAAVLSKPLHLGDLWWHLRVGEQPASPSP
jgi:hypothetical protein